jgi:opacity protein-like surface antigen
MGILLAVVLVAGPSAADWNVYVAPGLGISGATVDTDGEVSDLPVLFGGSDEDSSPLLDFAVGLEVPMDELVPREWLLDVRLPNWPMRFELEAAGLREYEFKTDVGTEKFFTEFKATTLLVNTWLDIPLVSIYRPVQYTFSLGRQPTVRRWLEPASLYLGGGVGVGFLDINGTSNVVSVDDNPIGFAWNVGVGLNYALTDNVSLSTGYRYVGLGEQKLDISDPGITAGPSDELRLDPEVHEFRVGVRIRVFEFRSPWR